MLVTQVCFTTSCLCRLIVWFTHFPQDIGKLSKMSESEDAFSSQSRRKPVLDFMQILLMDGLLNVSASTNPHPMVLLMEVISYLSATCYLFGLLLVHIAQ